MMPFPGFAVEKLLTDRAVKFLSDYGVKILCVAIFLLVFGGFVIAGVFFSPGKREPKGPQAFLGAKTRQLAAGHLEVLEIGARVIAIIKTKSATMAYLAVGDGAWSVDLSGLDGKDNPRLTQENGEKILDVFLPEPQVSRARIDFTHPDTGVVDVKDDSFLWWDDSGYVKKSGNTKDGDAGASRGTTSRQQGIDEEKLDEEDKLELLFGAQNLSIEGVEMTVKNESYRKAAKRQAERVIKGFYISAGVDYVRVHWAGEPRERAAEQSAAQKEVQ